MNLFTFFVVLGIICIPQVVGTEEKAYENDSSSKILTSETQVYESVKILCRSRKDLLFEEVPLDDNKDFNNKNIINSKYPSVFIIHGWINKQNLTWMWNIADLLQTYTTWNTCVVDWSPVARLNVLSAARNSEYVGNFLAKILTGLSNGEIVRSEQIVVIGHSFGAKVAAHCSKQLKGKLGVIFALDPVAPELKPFDAYYTQCIFTAAGKYRPFIGNCQANFYVNGGKKQPMCDHVKNIFCSHQASILYFGFSLDPKNRFICQYCRANIFNVFCLFKQRDRLGIYSERASGVFECQTKTEPPFALDDDDVEDLERTKNLISTIKSIN